MERKTILLMSLLIFLVAVLQGIALAKESPLTAQEKKEFFVGEQAETHWHEMHGEWLNTFHHPTEWWTNTLDVRFREVYAENYTTMTQEGANNYAHYQRYRTRWGSKFNLHDNIDFNMRLTWEFFTWDKPDSRDSAVDFDEMIFDHFNLEFRDVFDMPLKIVFGRQDIILGNGWLVAEGTPADGSRTIFFDAIRATYDWQEMDTVLDVIYIQQWDEEDTWLQPINHRAKGRHLTQGQDERGIIAYATYNGLENKTLEGYYIYKEGRTSDYWGARRGGVDMELHTFGGALRGKLDENWSYSTEGAIQGGQKDRDDQFAFATNNRVQYAFHDKYKNKVFLDYEFLSGDEAGTSKDEAFDPLWGDYPQLQRGGDLPIYVWSGETGHLGEMTNFHRFGVGHEFVPFEKWTMQTLYNIYWADENTLGGRADTLAGPNYSDNGNLRGHMLTGYLKYKCCKNLSAHLLMDYFMPGDFYDSSSRDHALFLRFNIQYGF